MFALGSRQMMIHGDVVMKKKLGVIGVGSAGLLSLVHFCTWLDDSWEIYSIHNPARPILGIGESTNGGFVGLLERGTHFNLGNQEDLAALDATVKFGSQFSGWRDNSWVNPLLDGNTAIHFNNFHFKDFVYERLEKLWPKQFRFIEGEVQGLKNHPSHVAVTIDERDVNFDFVMDCTGFPSSYDDYTISDCTPVNRCQIHSVTDFEYEPFTDHIAHANGWMFGVPLMSRKTYGYMYNDTITTKEEAIEDMKRILKVDDIEDKEFKFKCYYTQNLVEGRICKNGNKALFFEPLVANSIFVYLFAARAFYDYMMVGVCADKTNESFVAEVKKMEDVVSYYYQGGSTYESKFWDYAAKHTKARIEKRTEFNEMMGVYKALKDRGILHTAPAYGFSPITWEIVDEQMGYGYIG